MGWKRKPVSERVCCLGRRSLSVWLWPSIYRCASAITFILARGIGDALIANDVSLKDVEALLDNAIAA
jgi:hypothetical protein